MKNKDLKYKIGKDWFSLIPMLLLLSVFGGISIWLYLSQNGAFIFTGFMTVLLILITLYVIYCCIFRKILIFEDGFYFQTDIGNGKYYKYSDIAKAWESDGKALNGVPTYYFNFRTSQGSVKRFSFLIADSDGIEYLINAVENCTESGQSTERFSQSDEWEYKISGSSNALFRIIVTAILLILFTALTVDQLRLLPNKYLFAAVGFGMIAVTLLVLLIRLVIMQFCFRLYIGKDEFYLQTNPLNGKRYKYREAISCREELKTSSHGTSEVYRYFFHIDFKNGKSIKLPFEKSVYESEFSVLQERINTQS